jgi:N-methylhydantoinase A/oxoprolinase/acetone carboxylase beta subunit
VLSVGVDLGGTFTDGYFATEEQSVTAKVPTFRFDLTRSVIQCLRAGAERVGSPIKLFLESIELLRLATTVGTNAIIEGTGARVGLLVERKHESLLYGGRPPEALFASFLDPGFVRGLDLSISPEEVLAVCRELVGLGVRQVVVSLPRSCGASAEDKVRELVRARYPEHYLRSIPLQLGSEVSACAEDDVRTATAVVNAYLHRDMAHLLQRAEHELRAEGVVAPLLVVHANSGVARVAKTTAISTYGSGPSAGLSGAESIARAYGDRTVVTADMGGTTLDLGLVLDGQCEIETRPSLAGVRVALPMNRTESFGRAGCSIVRVEGGAIVIGPQSAGAVPGPAAFGRGGDLATITDADLVSGLLTPGKELGGQFVLDLDRARVAVERDVAVPLETTVEAAAWRTEETFTEQLADSLRAFLAARGIEAETAVVYAFGGAGPVHLWAPAARAGIRRVRSFPFGSAFSAFGCTVVDVRHRYEAPWDAGTLEFDELVALLFPLLARGLADVRSEGFGSIAAEAVFRALGKDGVSLVETQRIQVRDAEEGAQRLASYAANTVEDWERVDAVALELIVPVPHVTPTQPPLLGDGTGSGSRAVWWAEMPTATPVYRWPDLPPSQWVDGPLLVEEPDTTHAVGPGWRLRLDERGNALWEKR